MHGKTSPIEHDGDGVFAGLPSPLTATRYHSLVVDPATRARLPRGHGARPPTARSWACVTVSTPVEGVQFHPESILTGRRPRPAAQLPRPRRLTTDRR